MSVADRAADLCSFRTNSGGEGCRVAAPAKETRPPDQEEAGWGTHRPQAPNPGRSIPLISASVRQLASLSSRRLTDHGRCWARIPAYDDRVQLRATLIVGLWILWALIWIASAIVFRPDSPESTPRRRRGDAASSGVVQTDPGSVHLGRDPNTSRGRHILWKHRRVDRSSGMRRGVCRCNLGAHRPWPELGDADDRPHQTCAG